MKMKKIAQGRDRRRERQLEAAERQLLHTEKLIAGETRLGKLPAETIQKLLVRRGVEETRLASLRSGAY